MPRLTSSRGSEPSTQLGNLPEHGQHRQREPKDLPAVNAARLGREMRTF
jgi:hypothetical protein